MLVQEGRRASLAGETAPLDSTMLAAREIHIHQLAIFVGDFEHLPRLQVHETGHEHVGNLADAGVVSVDVVVEKFAAVSDALFEFADAVLQLEEVLRWP